MSSCKFIMKFMLMININMLIIIGEKILIEL